MGGMCFWNGTIDALNIFLGNCLMGDHLDQNNIKDGMSLITSIFLCSYSNCSNNNNNKLKKRGKY
jgi:hypothetical protein